MSNPLLEAHVLPPFNSIAPEHAGPAVDAIIAEGRAAIALLAHAGEPDWASLPARMEELDDRLNQAWAPVAHLNAVVNSPAWREAYNACLPRLSAYGTEVGQNAELCNAYKRLAAGSEFARLDTAQQKVISNTLRNFRLSGVDLPEAEKKRFAAIEERLSAICAKFADNVLDATQAWEKIISDEAALSGLPDSARALLRELAAAKDVQGYRVTLDAPSYIAVMTYADDRALRQELYTAFVTRASEQGPQAGQFDNSAILEEILGLRFEQAQLLGYGSYAELSLVPKMAESVQQVVDFLLDLAQRARPGAEQDLVALKTFARDNFDISDFQPWDQAYASEKLKQARYAISQEQIRPYFPAPRVIDGMLRIAERLYGLEIRPSNEAELWHSDATYYEIFEKGEKIAAFYLDPYARANKRGGAWMADCRARRRLADGSLQLPVAFLTCNFNPPVDGKPALLTHGEVTTLFHEFGHGLHHMLTRVEVAAVSGISGVSWDAVELPSQFFENWCWDKEALGLMSGHVDTGAPLPDDLLQKMLAARNFQSGLQLLRQVEFSLFDMKIHAGPALSSAAVQAELDAVRAQIAVLVPPAFNRFQHSFTHIFAGGYAAGYYSYKWAEVLSADAFSRFEEEGIFNAETGQSFRDTILARGGSADAAELFRAFRGRDPSVDALLRHSGLK
jgi:oligopeptidase A